MNVLEDSLPNSLPKNSLNRHKFDFLTGSTVQSAGSISFLSCHPTYLTEAAVVTDTLVVVDVASVADEDDVAGSVDA